MSHKDPDEDQINRELTKKANEIGLSLEEYITRNAESPRSCLDILYNVHPDSIEELKIYINASITLRRVTLGITRDEAIEHFYTHRTFDTTFLDKCKVSLSSVHGNGLFATKDISPNEVITLYPSDVIVRRKGNSFAYGVEAGHPTLNNISVINDYCFGLLSSTLRLIGDPLKTDNPTFLAHICNDRVKCASPENVGTYCLLSQRLSNARFEEINGSFVALVSQKPIVNGKEIFVSYGPDYWLDKCQKGKDN